MDDSVRFIRLIDSDRNVSKIVGFRDKGWISKSV